MKNTAPAFTLIELLVVIVMIAVLASLAYAGAGAMIGRAHTTKCLSNMRQIGAAMQMFAGDHDGVLIIAARPLGRMRSAHSSGQTSSGDVRLWKIIPDASGSPMVGTIC
jgi:prepilin-type N-terminal cleavage/methylation domain-containing protein